MTHRNASLAVVEYAHNAMMDTVLLPAAGHASHVGHNAKAVLMVFATPATLATRLLMGSANCVKPGVRRAQEQEVLIHAQDAILDTL